VKGSALSSELPAPLAHLESKYTQLVIDAENGHISPQDAMASLRAIQVYDADQAVWGLDAEGNFIRASSAGEQPFQTNPTLFALVPTPSPTPTTPNPHALPTEQPFNPAPGAYSPSTAFTGAGPAGPGPFPAGPGWAGSRPDEPTPPAYDPAVSRRRATQSGGQPHPVPMFNPELDSPPAGSSPGLDPFAQGRYLPGDDLPAAGSGIELPKASRRMSRNLDSAGQPNQLVMVLTSVKAWLVAHLTGVIIVIVALGVGLFLSHQGSPTSTPIPSAATAPAVAPDLPKTAAAPPPPADNSKVPSAATSVALISALESGNTRLVAAALVDPTAPDRRTLTSATALWAGTKAMGVAVTPGPAAAAGASGGAVQTWVLSASSVRVTGITVQMQKTKAGWKLVELPTY